MQVTQINPTQKVKTDSGNSFPTGPGYISCFGAPAKLGEEQDRNVPLANNDLKKIYRLIKGKKYEAVTKQLRKIIDADLRSKYKDQNLVSVTFNGTFSYRSYVNLIDLSGYFIADYDDVSNIPELIERLKSDTRIRPVLIFISPSGTGVKAVYKVDTSVVRKSDSAQMYDAWHALNGYVAVNYSDILKPKKKSKNYLCPSGKDIARLCYLPHDPNVFYNPHEDSLIDISLCNDCPAPVLPKHVLVDYSETDSPELFANAITSTEASGIFFEDGSKHTFLLKVGSYCNHYGMSKDYACEQVIEHYAYLTDISDERLLIPIHNAYKTYSIQHGSLINDPEQWFKDECENETVTKENKYLQLFNQSLLDQAINYPLPVPVVNLIQDGNTVPLLTLAGLSAIQGKEKSKKTTLLAIIAASITNDYAMPLDNTATSMQAAMSAKVLWLDMEQGESYGARTMNLILKMAGLTKSSNLLYSDMRQLSPAERLKCIEAALGSVSNIKLIVIDGIVDLMTDFMDSGEAHSVVIKLLALASKYSAHVACIIHENKKDNNARAHVGSILSQKCEIAIACEVDPYNRARSIVKCVKSRGLPFEDFSIKWDKGQLPCIDGQALIDDTTNIQKNTACIVFENGPLNYTAALIAIMKQIGKSKETAKRRLSEWQDLGYVIKGTDGVYRVQAGSKEGHDPGQG